MPAAKLDNYLRVYRQRAGLSQKEMSFLLGWKDAAQVSRYEKRRRKPTLEVALDYHKALGIPVEELFAGLSDQAAGRVHPRIDGLDARLKAQASSGKKQSRAIEKKLQWLAERTSQPQLNTLNHEQGKLQ